MTDKPIDLDAFRREVRELVASLALRRGFEAVRVDVRITHPEAAGRPHQIHCEAAVVHVGVTPTTLEEDTRARGALLEIDP
jgi:hypothetical protein